MKLPLSVAACAFSFLPWSASAQPADRQPPQAATPAAKDYSKSSVVTRLMAFDQNGDGKVSRDEVTDTRLLRLFDQADTGKTGSITKEQLVALATKLETEAAQSGGNGPRGGPGGAGGPGAFGGRGGPDGGPGGPGGGPGGRGGRGPGGPGAQAPVDWNKLPPAATAQGVTFEKDIQPLFAASCVKCHGNDRTKADLRLDTLAGLLAGGENGKVILPGNSKESRLVLAISQLDEETAMPPKRGPGGGGRGGFGRGPGGGGGPGGGPNGGRGPGDGGPGGPDGATGGPGGATGGPGGPGGDRRGPGGSPAQPLTTEQVGLVRAWIDQGAK